jgi:hypothetical protein
MQVEMPEHVIVLSIPDWGVTPFATGRDRGQISSEIDAFNQINLEESQKAGAIMWMSRPYLVKL